MTTSTLRTYCAAFASICLGLVVAGPKLVRAQEVAAPEWPAVPPVPDGDSTLDVAIGGAELRGHVQALSSDLLAGRPMGSDESLVAAQYAAQALEAMGVQPGAEDGTYFQRIDLFKQNYEGPSELHLVAKNGDETTLYYGEGFTFDSAAAALETGDLQCVMIAEESDIPAEPDPSIALIFQTSAGRAAKWLRDAGFNRGTGFGLVIVPRKKSELGKGRSTKRAGALRPAVSAKGGIVAKMSGPWGSRAYEGELSTVRFVPVGTIERRFDVNVIGVVPGIGTEEQPELKDEVVMLSAHRDHIGLYRQRGDQPLPDDIIMNGADDDASGCAVVLEIAEAFAQGEAPARTLAVVLVTGEEVGMVGSGYWASSPTVAPEKVVCALNFEMLGRPDPLTDGPGNVWLTGFERSDLGPSLIEHGVKVTPDVRPKQNFFVRSDNVSFARIGIVSQTLSSFGGHSDYHKASDEWDSLDYDHMESAAAVSLAAVRDLVSGRWKPKWNEGEPNF